MHQQIIMCTAFLGMMSTDVTVDYSWQEQEAPLGCRRTYFKNW
jgi:hypothetical protein